VGNDLLPRGLEADARGGEAPRRKNKHDVDAGQRDHRAAPSPSP